jgi:hypothetical protein
MFGMGEININELHLNEVSEEHIFAFSLMK